MNRFLTQDSTFRVDYHDKPDEVHFVVVFEKAAANEKAELFKVQIQQGVKQGVFSIIVPSEMSASELQHVGQILSKYNQILNGKIYLNCGPTEAVDIIFGYFVGQYSYKPKPIMPLTVSSDLQSKKEAIDEIIIIARNYCSHKYLTESPANEIYPTSFVEMIDEHIGKANNVRHVVYKQEQIQSMNMGCLMSVAKASAHEPAVSVIYLNEHLANTRSVVLVGKGVVFDSGGLNIKTGTYMASMNQDMAGASLVFHLIKILIDLQLPVKVIGLLGLVENSISGNAYRPTDILTSMNGSTVEVINTDAEGRLVMADLFCLADKLVGNESASAMIDFATLTGAASVAVGANCCAYYTKSNYMLENIDKISKETGDRLYPIPTYNQFKYALESKLADIANCTTKPIGAGASTAGAFLEHFVSENLQARWTHFDVASFINGLNPGEFRESPTFCIRTFTKLISELK